jgi:DNA-binding HxlR family transcriptional regulator
MTSPIPMPGQPVRGSATGRPIMALFDLLGRAWAMGIIWQLEGGPYTFRVLRARCDDVSPSLLNNRLKELRATSLVALGPDGYHLTPLGEELLALLKDMGKWSTHWAKTIG